MALELSDQDVWGDGSGASPSASQTEQGAPAGHVMGFDTPLEGDEEQQFQLWKKQVAPNDSGFDYDLRGAFKAGAEPDPETGHWPDTFKKPNHPTFSNQSMYAPVRPDLAGHWEGDKYVPPSAGIRNNNPTNIKASGDEWEGAKGKAGGFVKFDTPENGIRAAVINLQSKTDKHGLNTVADIIGDPKHGWAPPNENDTPSYIAAVSQQLGVDPFQPIDVKDPETVHNFIKAVIQRENGQNPYSDEQISRGMQLAGMQPPPAAGELSDAQVWGGPQKELSDADVWGTPAKPAGSSVPVSARAAVQGITESVGGLVSGAGRATQALGQQTAAWPERRTAELNGRLNIMNAVETGQPLGHLVGPDADFARAYQQSSPAARAAMRQNAQGIIAGLAAQTGDQRVGAALQSAGQGTAAAGQAVTQFGQQHFPLTEDEQKSLAAIVPKLVTGLGAYVGAGVVGGLPLVLGVAGVQGFGDGYDAAKAKGASDQTAAAAGLFSGLAQGGLMTLPVHQAMEAMDRIPAALRGKYLELVTGMAKSGATFTAFGQLSTLADNLVAKATYDPERPLSQGLGQNVAAQFLAGALVPPLGAAAAAGARRLAGERKATPPPPPPGGPSGEPPPGPEGNAPNLEPAPAPTPPPPPPDSGLGTIGLARPGELPRPVVMPEKEAEPPSIETRIPPTPEATPQKQSAPSGLESIDPSTIGVDAQRFQFKSGGDESGVTDRLKGVEKWDPRLAGTVLVWRDPDGKDWIADGHQRLALANRLVADGQDGIRVNAFVLNSADGHTDGDARAIAAAKNIAEGTGSSIDAAKVIREAAAKGTELPPLPPRSALVRDGRALAALSPDAFGMVVNEVIPANHDAVVGRLVKGDAEQVEALRVLAAAKPENVYQAEAIVRDVIATGMERGTNQGGLFGPEDVANSVVLERAKIMDEARKQVARDKNVFGVLVKEGERIASHGANTLDPEANKQRLTADEVAHQYLTTLATTKGPVSDALSAIARRFKSGEISRAEAAREFLGIVRGAVEKGVDQGTSAGGAVARPAEQEAEAKPVAAPEPEPEPAVLKPPPEILDEKMRTEIARANGLPDDAYFHLPYAEWRKIEDEHYQKQNDVLEAARDEAERSLKMRTKPRDFERREEIARAHGVHPETYYRLPEHEFKKIEKDFVAGKKPKPGDVLKTAHEAYLWRAGRIERIFKENMRVIGLDPKDPTRAILLTRDLEKPDAFRVTSFHNGEPVGHREYRQIAGAESHLNNAAHEFEGYEIQPDPHEVEDYAHRIVESDRDRAEFEAFKKRRETFVRVQEGEFRPKGNKKTGVPVGGFKIEKDPATGEYFMGTETHFTMFGGHAAGSIGPFASHAEALEAARKELLRHTDVSGNSAASARNKVEAAGLKEWANSLKLPEGMSEESGGFNAPPAPKGWESVGERGAVARSGGSLVGLPTVGNYGVKRGVEGLLTDISDEFRDYANSLGLPLDNPINAARAAASYLLHRGLQTGRETLVTIHPESGHVTAHTAEKRDAVEFSENVLAALENPDTALISLHNHPSSSGPSGNDIRTLVYPGHKTILVVTRDGHWYAARLTNPVVEYEKVTPETAKRMAAGNITVAARAAAKAADKYGYPRMEKGEIHPVDAMHQRAHITNSALERAGLIDYMTDYIPGLEHREWMEKAIEDATDAARTILEEARSIQLAKRRGRDDVHRPAWTVSFDRAAAGLFARNVPAEGSSGHEGSAPRSSGRPKAKEPYRSPTQIKLLERPRGFSEDEERDVPEPPLNPVTGKPINVNPLRDNLAIIRQLGREGDIEGLEGARDFHNSKGLPPSAAHEQSPIAAKYAQDLIDHIRERDKEPALPPGYHFVEGRGPLGKGKWGVAKDGDLHAVWNYHGSKEEAARASVEHLRQQEGFQKEAAARAARDREIAGKLRAGGPVTDADLKHLNLKPASAGFEWLSPVVQRLFGISKAKVREAMGDALKKGHTNSGTEFWMADPRKALANAAAYAGKYATEPGAPDELGRPVPQTIFPGMEKATETEALIHKNADAETKARIEADLAKRSVDTAARMKAEEQAREIKRKQNEEFVRPKTKKGQEPDLFGGQKPDNKQKLLFQLQQSEPTTETVGIGADLKRLIDLFGPKMYDTNMPQVTAKELLQNSFDAVKAAYQRGDIQPGTGHIQFIMNKDSRELSVSDNGSGMSPETVKNAFLTIAGTNKDDLAEADRSGGFGVAKLAFIFGNKTLRLETVRDGVKTTLNTTGDELLKGKANLKTEPTSEAPHTYVSVEFPEFVKGSDGTMKPMDIPWQATGFGGFDALGRPLLGDVSVGFRKVSRDWRNELVHEDETLPLGRNQDMYGFEPLTVAHFPWGDAEVYWRKSKSKWDVHQSVLSSGIYQFDTFISEPGNAYSKLPYDLIFNVRPKVEASDANYPFNNQREAFSPKVKRDIAQLQGLLQMKRADENIQNLGTRWSTVEKLPMASEGDDPTGDFQSAGLKLQQRKGKGFEIPPRVTVENGKLYLGGEELDAEERAKAEAQLSVENYKFPPEVVPTDRPLYHNNLNVDPIEEAYRRYDVPTWATRSYLSELGSIVQNFKNLIATFPEYNQWAKPGHVVGLSFDKGYHGIQIKVPFRGFFINPASGKLKSPNAIANAMYLTMVHEAVHTLQWEHNEGFTIELHRFHGQLEDKFEDLQAKTAKTIADTIRSHQAAYDALKKVLYDDSTKNVEETKGSSSRGSGEPEGETTGLLGRPFSGREEQQLADVIRRSNREGDKSGEQRGNVSGSAKAERAAGPGARRVEIGEGVYAELPERPSAREQAVIDRIRKIAQQLVPKAEVLAARRITGSGEAVRSTHNAGIMGVARVGGARDLIAWSLQSPDAVGTLRHEAIHWLRHSEFFRPSEWNTLVNAARNGDWLRKHNILARYPTLHAEGQIEEAIADQFAQWRRSPKSTPAMVRPLFDRLASLLGRVGSFLRKSFGEDVSHEDIFRRIESGEIGKRGNAAPAPAKTGFGRRSFQLKRPSKDELRDLMRKYNDGYLTHDEVNARLGADVVKPDDDWTSGERWDANDLKTAVNEVDRRIAAQQAERRQTETPEFKKWFGESKVVDSSGQPLVVYHGSPERGFDKFDESKINPSDPDGPANGFFFSSNKDEALGHGQFPWRRPNAPNAEVRPFYLSLKNPATRAQAWAIAKDLRERGQPWGPNEVRAELQNRGYDGYIAQPPVRFSPEDIARLKAGEEVPTGIGRQTLKLDPATNTFDLYDPAVGGHVTGGWKTPQEFVEEAGHGTFVAFRPEQIKSAVGNRGTFDPKDARIHYQLEQASKPPKGFAEDDDTFKDPRESARALVKAVNMALMPMAEGANHTRATVKDWLNRIRLADWHGGRMDKLITDNFDLQQQEKMWTAGDEESVLRQTGRSTQGRGLDTLTPAERETTEALQTDANNTWAAAQAVGMVEGEGLPSYMPRMFVKVADNGETSPLRGREVKSIPGYGREVTTTTPQLKHRKYLTTEESEAAASAKYETDARVVRNIRTLPLATARLRRAVAGRALINAIKEHGRSIGEETVVEGAAPGNGEHKWFTMDNPSFTTWRPRMVKDQDTGKWSAMRTADGEIVFEKIPIYVRDDWEGPLRAGLTEPEGAIYRAFMSMKAKAMNNIMFSPFVQLHLMTELGRAFPAAPLKTLTLRIITRGRVAKNDPALMTRAILAGLVPVGRHFERQDISGMMEAPQITPGRSLTAKTLGYVPGLFDPKAGDAVYRAIDAAGNFMHNTMLWDQVASLQAGLFDEFSKELVNAGYDQQTADRVAAHEANRFAGTLPKEAMSQLARKIANVALFSRTYTLGNIGVVKDVVTGLPRDVQAQIERDAGTQTLQKVKSFARRRAIARLALDIALIYASTSLVQNAFQYFSGRQTGGEILQGYIDRWKNIGRTIEKSPQMLLDPFMAPDTLSSTATNEIDPQTGRPLRRVLVGYDKQGSAIYARNPVGKFAEEYANWIQGPIATLKSKLSPFLGPTLQVIANNDGLDKKIYQPSDSPEVAIAKIIGSYIQAMVPMDQLQSAYDIMTGQAKSTDAAKLLGRTVGVTFRRGYPGGPAAGYAHEIRSAHEQAIQSALPGIHQQYISGDHAGAIRALTKLNVPRPELNSLIRAWAAPASRAVAPRYATPEQRNLLRAIPRGQ